MLAKRFLSLLVVSLLLISCKKFKERRLATITFNFQTELNQSDFDLLEKFNDTEGRTISIELIKFYLSDFSFIDEDGEEIKTNDISLIELDKNGKAMFETNIEAGTYSAIKFGIGVPQVLNETDPSSFNEMDHPLNITNNTYWGMNTMYRFVMIDGRYFENSNFVGTFSYHTGHNESYRTIRLDKKMTFDKKGDYSEIIYIDISKILEGSGGSLDIENEPNYHGNLDDYHLSEQLSNNFSNVFRI